MRVRREWARAWAEDTAKIINEMSTDHLVSDEEFERYVTDRLISAFSVGWVTALDQMREVTREGI